MSKLLEWWEGDKKPDVTMYAAELLEGSTVETAADITGKTVHVELWANGTLVRTITDTTVTNGPLGEFTFSKVQNPAIAPNKYGVLIIVDPGGANERSYPSSKYLPAMIVHNKGEAK